MMRATQISLCFVLLVVVVACSSLTTVPGVSGGASNKEKIVGIWEFVKVTGGDPKDSPPPGSTVEFTRDGKTKISLKVGAQPSVAEGTYTVDGDTLKMTSKGPGGMEHTDTVTITKLTEKEMVIEEKKAGKTETTELKKKQ
jgi:uncharacterized protein (TIGR03066 family)